MAKKSTTETVTSATEPEMFSADGPSISERALASVSERTIPIGTGAYKLTRQITRPVLPQVDGQKIFVEFQSAPYDAEPLLERATGRPLSSMAPPRLAHVRNLATDALNLLIMNTVLESELDNAYPGGYVGRCFVIVRFPHHNADKRYKLYQIAEIEPE